MSEQVKTAAVIDVMIDGVTITDMQGRVIDANRAVVEQFGYEREEIIGETPGELFIVEKESPRFFEAIKFLLSGEPIEASDYLCKRKDGMEFPVSVSLSLLRDTEGEPYAIVAVSRDITERKRMEQEIQGKNEQLDAQNEELQSQAEELMAQQHELMEKSREVEEANRLKSEFLAHMSHELRTPLNAIIGFSELMLDKVPGKINEEQRQCLDDILESGKHLLHLVNDVLDLSKIESGKVEFKMENIALPEVIEPLARTMMPILTSRKQSLEVEIEEGIPPVYADEAKLEQVLLNLLDNSSKFTPNGGKLKIEAMRENGWCQVTVIDNGIGIKKEDQKRIFEPFSQLDNPLSRKSGAGLGLALVNQIVKRYGGQIWVESKYRKGSRFTFTLPVAKAD